MLLDYIPGCRSTAVLFGPLCLLLYSASDFWVLVSIPPMSPGWIQKTYRRRGGHETEFFTTCSHSRYVSGFWVRVSCSEIYSVERAKMGGRSTQRCRVFCS